MTEIERYVVLKRIRPERTEDPQSSTPRSLAAERDELLSCSNGTGPTFKNSVIRNNTIPATCVVSNSIIMPVTRGPASRI